MNNAAPLSSNCAPTKFNGKYPHVASTIAEHAKVWVAKAVDGQGDRPLMPALITRTNDANVHSPGKIASSASGSTPAREG